MANIDDAIEQILAYPDAFTLPEKRWSDVDFANVSQATKLSIPNELAAALRKYGYIEREAELYFEAVFADGSTAVGEIQILFSAADRIIKDHQNINEDPAHPDRGMMNYILFGTADGGRSFLLADGKNLENDAVFYWPLAFDPLGEGDNTRCIAKVGNSLGQFLLGLRTADKI